jgi:phenylacetate-coenzyme A ligase PaaK-like adenylate-forming protein
MSEQRTDLKAALEMRDYETRRQLHLSYAIGLSPRFIERLDWSADRLALHRAERLRGLVRDAIARSPWHRERLADVDPDRLDEDGLRALPTMTKRDLMENFDRIVADDRLSLERVNDYLQTVTTGSYLLDRYTAVTSGGSSGERGVFVYDWEGWATFWLGMGRYLVRAKQRDAELSSRPAVLGWVTAAHFTHASAALSRTFASPDFVNVRFPVTLATERIVAGLNETQPDFLFAYPSAIHVLAFAAHAGRLRIAPHRIFSLAEPLLPEIRAVAEEAWGVGVGNVWGASEGGVVGTACDESRMHLSEDLVIVEPVDGDGRPVPPGQRSHKVYLTNLFNRALPLIRYEITDEVTILSEPCPCGSAYRCVADIQGRLDDVFVYGDLRVHPYMFRSVLGAHAGVTEYQVRQTARGARIAVRCGARVGLARLSREIAEGLRAVGVRDPVIEVEAVERLERDPGPAKLRRFVPLTLGAHRPAEPLLSAAG